MSKSGAQAILGQRGKTKLNRDQITGFLAAWFGWILDGMDAFIYALVLGPALTELLPKSGYAANTENIGFFGSIMFALFLIGWGMAFLWGPIGDRFGRTRTLAATIIVYSIFTGAAAFAQDIWQLAVFRLLAGLGVGGNWAISGTYVAEMLPEDRRKFAGGVLNAGILCRILYRLGIKSNDWRELWLAADVLLWVLASRNRTVRPLFAQRARTLDPASANRKAVKSTRSDLSSAVLRPYACDDRPSISVDHWVVGGIGLCADRDPNSQH